MSRLLSVVQAEYDYSAAADDELTIAEGDVLFVLDDSDPEWWKVRPRQPASEAASPAPEGVVPKAYVTPLIPIREVLCLYEYSPQNDEELETAEDEPLLLYEEEDDWSLCGKEAGGAVGWLPAAWIQDADEAEASTSKQPNANVPGEDRLTAEPEKKPAHEHQDNLAAPSSPPPQPAASSISATRSMPPGDPQDVQTWSVTEIDKKKKKKKGTLLVGNGAVFFTSESDKTPVQQYSLSTLESHRVEKNKHLYLSFSSGEEVHFSISSKDALEDIIGKIEKDSSTSTKDEVDAEHASSAPAHKSTDSLPKQSTPASSPPSSTSPAPRFLPPPTRTVPPVKSPSPSAASSNAVDDRSPATATTVPQPSAQHVPPEIQSATASQKLTVVLYDFDSEASDELTVREGERVIVLDDSSDEWWKVKRENNDEEGVIPASYVNDEADDPAVGKETAGIVQKRDEEAKVDEEEAESQSAAEERIKREETDARAARKLQAEEEERNRQRRLLQEHERQAREEHEVQEREARQAEKEQKAKEKSRQKEAEREHHKKSSSSKKAVERPKPSPHRIRTWKDRTGQFKVEAEFLGVNKDKIRLHKLNGVIIEVPIQKMSNEDISHIHQATGQNITPAHNDNVPLATAAADQAKKSQKQQRHPSGSNSPANNHGQLPKVSEPKKPPIDWFEFFLNAGCDIDDCTRYAGTFEKDRIDEAVLPEVEASTLRTLGLKEGDILRVGKVIREKYTNKPPPTPDKPSFAENKSSSSIQEQLKKDEEFARSLSEQDQNSSGRNDSGGLFTSPNGTLKNTRRGRPRGNSRAASTPITADTIANASDQLQRTSSPRNASNLTASPPPMDARSKSSAQEARANTASSGGFDDDAWTVKSKPLQPTSPPAPAPAPASAPTPAPAAPVSSPAPAPPAAAAPNINRTASPQASYPSAQAMNENALARLGIGSNTNTGSGAQGHDQPPASAPPQSANGPRGPLAPVPSNQGLLNPLISTSSELKPWVPTSGVKSQPTGFNPSPMGITGPAAGSVPMSSFSQSPSPQPTASSLPSAQPAAISQQPTGFAPGGSQPQQFMTTGVSSQPSGFSQASSSFSSPSPSVFPQATAMSSMPPHPTGFNQPTFTMGPPQVPYSAAGPMPTQAAPQPPPSQQQQQPTQQQSSSTSQFQPENVFAQMKTGKFGKGALESAPQNESKYDSLRAQPTGWNPGFVQPPPGYQAGASGGWLQPGQPQQPQQQQQQQQQQQFGQMTGVFSVNPGLPGQQTSGMAGMGGFPPQQQQQPQQQPNMPQQTGFINQTYPTRQF